jgi:hypothetical protein
VTGEGVTACVGVGQIKRQEVLLMNMLQEERRSLEPQLWALPALESTISRT